MNEIDEAGASRPVRIQLERRLGWKLPPGSRSCARPHLFGNPFPLGTYQALARVPAADMVTPWEYEGRVSGDGTRHDIHWPGGEVTVHHVRYMTRAEVVATHRRALIAPTSALRLYHRRTRQYVTVELVRRELAGLNLACYCRLDHECHVDTLLWVANAPEVEIKEAAEEEYEIIRAMAERVAQLHPAVLAAAGVG
jgi:hypothetical protein